MAGLSDFYLPLTTFQRLSSLQPRSRLLALRQRAEGCSTRLFFKEVLEHRWQSWNRI